MCVCVFKFYMLIRWLSSLKTRRFTSWWTRWSGREQVCQSEIATTWWTFIISLSSISTSTTSSSFCFLFSFAVQCPFSWTHWNWCACSEICAHEMHTFPWHMLPCVCVGLKVCWWTGVHVWIDKIEQQQQVKDHWKSASEEFQISSRRWRERRNGKIDKKGNKLNVNFSNLNYSSFINDLSYFYFN